MEACLLFTPFHLVPPDETLVSRKALLPIPNPDSSTLIPTLWWLGFSSSNNLKKRFGGRKKTKQNKNNIATLNRILACNLARWVQCPGRLRYVVTTVNEGEFVGSGLTIKMNYLLVDNLLRQRSWTRSRTVQGAWKRAVFPKDPKDVSLKYGRTNTTPFSPEFIFREIWEALREFSLRAQLCKGWITLSNWYSFIKWIVLSNLRMTRARSFKVMSRIQELELFNFSKHHKSC